MKRDDCAQGFLDDVAPYNEMIQPGAPRLLAEKSPNGVWGQAVLDCLSRVRRRRSPISSEASHPPFRPSQRS